MMRRTRAIATPKGEKMQPAIAPLLPPAASAMRGGVGLCFTMGEELSKSH